MTDTNNVFPMRARRVPVKIPITRSSVGMFLDSTIMNLSKGGVFIRTDIALPLGSTVDFEFTLPSSNRTIRTSGTVVWTRQRGKEPGDVFPEHPPGIGVQFRELAPSDLDLLSAELERLMRVP